jgi:hypothetical protein
MQEVKVYYSTAELYKLLQALLRQKPVLPPSLINHRQAFCNKYAVILHAKAATTQL